MGQGNWSMRMDRELIELARAELSAEKIASKMDRPYSSVANAAKRLGIKFGPQPARLNGRLKAKPK